MAKVQPLYGAHKYDWKVRLESLVTAIGEWALWLGEEGTKRTSMSLHRGGMRFTLTSRIWGGRKYHDTCIQLYGRKASVRISVKNYKIIALNDPETLDKLDDYRAIYKLMERRVYATFTPDQAADIMSRGDDNYNARQRLF